MSPYPSFVSLTSTASLIPLTSNKRPNLGEMAEAPDLKKASLSTGFERQQHSEPPASVAAALRGID